MNSATVRALVDNCMNLLDHIQYKQNEEPLGYYAEFREQQLRKLVQGFQENFECLQRELSKPVDIV